MRIELTTCFVHYRFKTHRYFGGFVWVQERNMTLLLLTACMTIVRLQNFRTDFASIGILDTLCMSELKTVIYIGY